MCNARYLIPQRSYLYVYSREFPLWVGGGQAGFGEKTDVALM